MSHVARDKKKLVARLNRLIGQLQGVRAQVEQINNDDDPACFQVMQQLAAARGALTGLMKTLLEGHVDEHIVEQANLKKRQGGAEELLRVLRSFMK